MMPQSIAGELMTLELPKDNKLALRQVVRACHKASLATLLAEGGAPYASLVTVALDHDLSPILLLSELSDHSRNIAADPRVSLLFDGTDGHPNPQTGPRVTVMGHAVRVDDPRLRRRFLARHPGAALYADFADFAFWRVVPERAHFIGGFGRAVWFPAPFGLDPAATAEMRAGEDGLLPLILPGGENVVGIDVDGIDAILGDAAIRIAFPESASSLAKARECLENLQKRGQF